MPALTGPEEESLLQRASGLMKRGDVTGARLLFEHLAYRGSALGAFALAQSYDSRYLSKIYVRGLAADQKQADFWYRRAAELGGSGQSATGRR
jgi:TPR repeat protein